MMMNMQLKTEWLRANCEAIHYFGLGFIVVKLNDELRLHFYSPEYTSIVSDEDVHNHRYSFTSKILKGIFHQETFNVQLGVEGGYILSQESCREGESMPYSYPCSIEKIASHTYTAGSEYFIGENVFHRVKGENCITLIQRDKDVSLRKRYAEVVRKVNAPKVCPFSVKVSEEELWEAVGRMIKG